MFKDNYQSISELLCLVIQISFATQDLLKIRECQADISQLRHIQSRDVFKPIACERNLIDYEEDQLSCSLLGFISSSF